jgi:flagellar biosynthetic protein FliP
MNPNPSWMRALLVVALLVIGALPLRASALSPNPVQDPERPSSAAPIEASAPKQSDDPAALGLNAPRVLDDARMSTAVEIAVLLTVLSLLPAVLITVTSFTRIVIVMSFVRRALSTNELPPNPVIIGLSLFLTAFVMGPVAERIHDKAWVPYQAHEIGMQQAGDIAWVQLRGFLVANTRESELELFANLAKLPPDQSTTEALPLRVVVPAFVVSELKTAFQMGFLLFLPFLVIDLVVASVLLSMGMVMLPPVMISTPFKILLFVLVDGWHLLSESLVTSFITT